jgi:hypothetical protein
MKILGESVRPWKGGEGCTEPAKKKQGMKPGRKRKEVNRRKGTRKGKIDVEAAERE